ncbi:uncharacterized protein LOC131179884 isoform X2 [Hevea brasiliensis]|uniref:uncharacterized protein LOC131179884 isoform X2 n=1 Tax=Hevea brasiliensis TaxID=3981 RepID=UPI00260074FD|nr:uncharacterized protein LOC131179884 isoform X2 [Hevea brasiliensis]XP_058002728.1 uncharacterized protein LOC131179884 isoform X2 [Hevea brasiliensis]
MLNPSFWKSELSLIALNHSSITLLQNPSLNLQNQRRYEIPMGNAIRFPPKNKSAGHQSLCVTIFKESEDATQSRMQMKQSWSCIPMSILRKVCWIICLIIEAAALLFLLVIFCAAI